MASFNPPKRGVAYRMFVGLRSQADTRLFQVNPTLAAGDVKVSKDGAALANVTTLPTVIGSSAVVQVDLSSTEMTADNVTILLSDAAGGQWCDLMINLQTAARQFDELASQASVDVVDDYVDTELAAVLAAVDTEIAAIKAKTDNLPSDPADDSDIDAQLATIAGYLDTELAAVLAAVDTEIAAIKAKTDNLPASPAAVGSEMTLADGAITSAKLAGSGLNAVADAILKRDWSAVTGEASRSMLNALRFLRNRWYASGLTLTVTKEDDSTAAWTAALTKDASSDPITGADPN